MSRFGSSIGSTSGSPRLLKSASPSLGTCTLQAGEGRDCDHYDANQERGRRHTDGQGIRQREQDNQYAEEN
jgi:hypothetical protein